jgi:hypothetical protein
VVNEGDDKKRKEDRKKRQNDLEMRIGRTRSGYDWLRRVEQIGKDNTGLEEFIDIQKEGEDGEDTTSP